MTAAQTEDRVLALLRNRYEGEGFSFIEHPGQADLPAFMKGYRPDALALGKDKSIAIEVKLHRRPVTEESLRAVSERFKAQPHWEFRVVYGDEVEEEPIGAPTREQILAQIVDAEAILAQSFNRAAFVLGWAAIEAIARTLDPDFPSSGPRTMRQAVELLEHTGRLPFQQAQELRRLSPLRDKLVHGDFQTSISAADVEPVLGAARAALDASSES
jgi:hypothetical protein